MKKRILSLILALSMVLSVLPLGAFAADPPELVMGANGLPVYSEGTVGHNWVYMNGTLCLLYGTFDFSSTHPQNTSAGTQTAPPVACPIEIESDAEITGGIFEKAVTNNGGTIYDGTFNTMVENNVVSWGTLGKIVGGAFNGTVTNKGTISGGAFNATVTNNAGGKISGGAFQSTGSVTNYGTIENGTFAGKVTNYTGVTLPGGTISGGTFYGSVTNLNTIEKGTFEGNVTNSGTISGGTFQSKCSVENYSYIENGTFEGSVTNYSDIEKGTFKGEVKNHNGTISGGKFEGTVINDVNGTISDGTFNKEVSNINGNIANGTFNETVTNDDGGTISGGTFAGGVNNKNDRIYGGVFNGNATLTNVTGLHSITWDAVSSKAKIVAVNDVSAVWDPYAYKDTTVTITADTEIYSLNGESISADKYVNGNKKTVKFTMPGENVVLNKAITCTDLVMKGGYPEASNNGEKPCSGDDWEYAAKDLRNPTGKLILKGKNREFDFSLANPQDTTNKTPADSAVKCAIESGVKITGGTFEGSVKNHWDITDGIFYGTVTNVYELFDGSFDAGKISDGTFHETVTNNSGSIVDGTFKGDVINNNPGNIAGGTFAGIVTNSGSINGNGIFKNTVTNNGYIYESTFNGTVTNDANGTIYGGTFKGTVTNDNNAKIYGGVFNGKTGLDGVTGLHSITWDAASSKAKIVEVNGVPAEWDPYVVVTERTTDKMKVVTITADTDIFSLNGRLLGESDHVNGYENTVKFTMPNGPVELNGAITCTDLVMEGGWPKDSNGGTIPCSGTGWSYDHITKTLTLTSGEYDFSSTEPVACAIESSATITGGTFEKKVTNNAGGIISGGTFQDTCSVTNSGTIKNGTFKDVCSVTNEGANATIENGTFKNMCRVTNGGIIKNGTFKNMCSVENNTNGTISGGTFTYKVENNGIITGGVFNRNANLTGVTGGYNITVASNAKIEKVNGVSADWAPYVVTSNATTKEVTITADTEIFSLNGQPIAESSYGSDKTTVTFTMPDDDVVLNKAITSTDLVMENGWPKDSNGGKNPCKGDGWEYIKNDPTNGDMLLLTGSNQTGGLYDFSAIGDGSAVECNVFVGKPTAITGGEFNGKVFNNSGILGGTFNGEVVNRAPGIIKDGTFHGAVENNGIIENGAFHDAVKNNGMIENGAFNGEVENNNAIKDGTFNDEVVNTTMGRIEDGTFHKPVENDGTIEKGTFNDAVKNNNTINDGTFNGKVENNGTIEKGTFNGAVENNNIINGGTFNGAVTGSGTVSESITGSGTLNGELITKTPEPKPEPEPTTYTVTVIGGTIDGKTSVSAKENDTLTVVLDQNDIPDGMTFDLWSISSDKLSGDINVDYRAEAMTFQMPAEDVTIRAQYRSAEIIEDAAPSPLATAATIAVGGAAAGIVVWQGVSLGVDLYLANALPQGVPVPTDRRALALLLWETAGKPEVALPTLYGDVPAEEIELQKATHWAVQNGLMDAADKKDASFFDPDHYVTKMDVFGAWLRLKKLLGTT